MSHKTDYQELVKEYKKLKQDRDLYLQELMEKKGNLTAYKAEKEEYIKKVEALGVDPKDLKKEIESKMTQIKNKISQNQKICDELKQENIG